MKVLFCFTILVATVAGQLPRQGLLTSVVGKLCEESSVTDCPSKAEACVKIRTSAENAGENRPHIRACARGKVRPQQVLSAIAAVRESGGDIIDNLPVDQETIKSIRLCVLDKLGLLEGGAPNEAAIKDKLKTELANSIQDQDSLLNAMTSAVDTCTFPTNGGTPREYRKCMLNTCLENIVV